MVVLTQTICQTIRLLFNIIIIIKRLRVLKTSFLIFLSPFFSFLFSSLFLFLFFFEGLSRFSALCMEYLGKKKGYEEWDDEVESDRKGEDEQRKEYFEENCRIIHGEFAFLKFPCALRPEKEYVLDLCVSLSYFAVM